MNNMTQTTDTRLLQTIIAIAAFTMLAVAIFNFSKNTSMSVPATMEWVSDTSSWKGGWK